MKKSATITLTLVTAVTLAACSSDTKPRRKLAGYRNPRDTTQTSSSPRAGYVPYYVYMGGSRGGSYGSRSSAGSASRGGFGSTGAGHASASS